MKLLNFGIGFLDRYKRRIVKQILENIVQRKALIVIHKEYFKDKIIDNFKKKLIKRFKKRNLNSDK